MKKSWPRYQLRYLAIALILGAVYLNTGCVKNTPMLDTTVNDPIMLDMMDWSNDMSETEDGGGSSGSSMSCYS